MIASDEIRLLSLLPGDSKEEIRLTIRGVRLRDEEVYNTLSYVWGDRTDQRLVTVSGRKVSITKNLYNALYRLRHPTDSITIWIDQLCIDQRNLSEKTHQVNLMRDIYRNAARCYLWLGETPEQPGDYDVRDAEGALDFIRLCAHPREDTMRAVEIPDTLSTPQQRSGACKAFRALTQGRNPWWQRIWTVQEVVLANEAIVTWGPLSFPWKIVEKAAYKLCAPGVPLPPLDVLETFYDLINDFTGPVRGLQMAKMTSDVPLDLLQRWRERKATDPRDKVYGLAGLLQAMPLPGVNSCDYTVSAVSLYTDVTISLIQMEDSLRALVGMRERFTQGLPSWVLDFAGTPDVETTNWWWDHSYRYQWFAADGNEPARCEVLQQKSVLGLHGVFLDKVAKVGSVLRRKRGEDVTNQRIIETILSWEAMVAKFMQTLPSGHYGTVWEDAFWRTIFGDLLMDEFPRRRGVASDALLCKNFCSKSGISTLWGLSRSLHATILNSALFVTETGYVGVGPENVQVGDEVWVLLGAKVPFVLRELQDSQAEDRDQDSQKRHTLVGDAFVYGVMDGEAVASGGERQQTVHIY